MMRGFLYACEWLQSPIVGDYPGHEPRPFVASRTRALWVPQEGILFQWPLPFGVIQISRPDSFPPPADVARVAFLEVQKVPYAAIREARKHFERMESVQSRRVAVQTALDRLTREQISSEGRVQTALTAAGIQRR